MDNWLIIAGNGRNTFKTSLACKIIETNRKQNVTGVKISPHFHSQDTNSAFIHRSDKFTIIRETEITRKDSSRMLQAGAGKVYYVECKDEDLQKAFYKLEELTKDEPVVCESGGMRDIIKPAIFVMMKSAGNSSKPGIIHKTEAADMVIDAAAPDPASIGSSIRFINGKWKKT